MFVDTARFVSPLSEFVQGRVLRGNSENTRVVFARGVGAERKSEMGIEEARGLWGRV